MDNSWKYSDQPGGLSDIKSQALFNTISFPYCYHLGVPTSFFDPLSTATLYGEDLSAENLTEAVAAVTAGNMSGYDAYSLLQYLLHNATGSLASQAVDVTGYVPLLNLPTDALQIVPWEGVVNGPTGALPATFWQKVGAAATALVNGMVALGQLIYGGLVALAGFLVALGEAIAAWGMALVGTVQGALQAVQAALEKVGGVLGEFVSFLADVIEAFFAPVYDALRAVWDATAGSYLHGIEEALGQAIAEFQMTGRISPSTASRLVAAFTAPLFWVVVGISVAVVVGYVVFAVSTLGLGVLLASVGLTIATALAWQVFGLAVTESTIGFLFDPGAAISQLIEPFISWYVSTTSIDPVIASIASKVIGAALATGSVIASFIGYAASDQSGSMAVVWGLSLGIFSLMLSFGVALGGTIGRLYAIIGSVFGFVGAFFSIIGMIKSKAFYSVPSLVGSGLAFTGSALGVYYGSS